MSNLEKFKMLEREATEGPWYWTYDGSGDYSIGYPDPQVEKYFGVYSKAPDKSADVRFIAEVRNLAPKLIRLWEAATKLCCRNQFCRDGSWCDLCLAKMELEQT